MILRKSSWAQLLLFPGFIFALFKPAPAFAQVSPAEISNSKLRGLEQKYFTELQMLHRAIADTKFPFAVYLTRYVTADPDQKVSFDARGIEFVNFQNEVVLKTSAIYRAAYNAEQLTQNERAARTFRDVIEPILKIVTIQIPPDVDCDAIGFEISYHTHAPSKSYEYEGKEILAVVIARDDAFALSKATDSDDRQGILNRSSIFVNGKEFGLALGARNPLDADARAEAAAIYAENKKSVRTRDGVSAQTPAESSSHGSSISRNGVSAEPGGKAASAPLANSGESPPAANPVPAPTAADVDRLQSRYQAQLDVLVKDGAQNFHLVDYAPPAFAVDHNRLVLQLTLRNTLAFDKNAGSIYKRAAQTFDLFLAPELKALVQKLPSDPAIDAFNFSVLNRLGSEKTSSEAVEFVCPVKSLRDFVNDEITSQDLVNQSVVLVNGVRIALNLQLVE